MLLQLIFRRYILADPRLCVNVIHANLFGKHALTHDALPERHGIKRLHHLIYTAAYQTE